jgi:chemotaxis protein CheY-P-specific phosphatase CheC
LIKDEKDNCRISNDVAEEFSTQLNDLIQAEVEINVNKINIDELDNITFTPADMAMLEDFIQFDSEE